MLRGIVPLRDIQAISGHKTLAPLERYLEAYKVRPQMADTAPCGCAIALLRKTGKAFTLRIEQL